MITDLFANPITSPIAETEVISLSVSDASVTDGDSVTFSVTGNSAGLHLRKDGVWIAGGEALPKTMTVGPLDAGNYTLCNADGNVVSGPVALAVSNNNLIDDSFTGSPSGSWSSTTGSVTVASNRLVISTGDGYLNRTISSDNLRIIITFNLDALSYAGGGFESINFLNIVGSDAFPVVSLTALRTGGANILRVSPNVSGFYFGATLKLNFNVADGYSQDTMSSGDHTYELRWDHTDDSFWGYLDGKPHLIARQAVGSGGFLPRAPIRVEVGNTNTATITGNVKVDDVKIKQGNAASTPYVCGPQTIVMLIGQSNAAGAAASSYSAVTDDIGTFIAVTSSQLISNARVPTVEFSGANSTNIAFAFIQNIQLPHNHRPVLLQGAVGSTGFESGWEDPSGDYRVRNQAHAVAANDLYESVHWLVILMQGFENDVAMNPATYKTLMGGLLDDLRGSIGVADVPFVIGGFTPAYLTGGEAPSANYIALNTANQEYAETDDINGAFADSVSPTPVGYGGDLIHFSAAGLRAMGERHAAAFITLEPRAEQ